MEPCLLLLTSYNTLRHATELERRLTSLASRWRVEVARVENASSGVVAFAGRDGLPVVLKVIARHHEEWGSGELMAAFRGHGVARVLEHEPGAVLLEELQPGTPLASLVQEGRDAEATEALIAVIDAMRRIAPATTGIRTVAEWGRGFERHLEAGVFDTVSQEIASVAREVYSELCATQGQSRLLHGDLQHFNVLLDSERGWVAIDPKGVVGELEFELSAALRNPDGPADLFTEREIRRRVSQFANGFCLDANRIGAWAFSSAVLSVIWMLEDRDPRSHVTSALEKAVAMRFLVS